MIIKPTLFNVSTVETTLGGSAFASEVSSNLSRTLTATSSDPRTFTISFFLKTVDIDAGGVIIGGGSTNSVSPYETKLTLNGDATISFVWNGNGSGGDVWKTTKVFRDISEYYHIVIKGDIANATRADRVIMEVNGETVIMTPTGAGNNSSTTRWLTNTEPHAIGIGVWTASNPISGYMAEFYLIDGQLLDYDNFVENDVITGKLNPKEYLGTFGTNGFYLPFTNGENAGEDFSGNGNDFIPSNVLPTGDSPYNNHPIINRLAENYSVGYENANRTVHGPNRDFSLTFNAPATGKYYIEASIDRMYNSRGCAIGVGQLLTNFSGFYQGAATENGLYQNGFKITQDTSGVVDDVIGLLIDADTNTLTARLNNVQIGAAVDYTPEDKLYIHTYGSSFVNSGMITLKASEDSWTYSAPNGYVALNSTNLPTPDIPLPPEYFKTFLYTGNGSGLQVGDEVQSVNVYDIGNSGAFFAEQDDYLHRTPTVVGDKRVWTLSAWLKFSRIDVRGEIFSAGYYNTGSDQHDEQIVFTSTNKILYFWKHDTVIHGSVITTAEINEVGKYYHIVVTRDTTTLKIYIDGILDTNATIDGVDGQFNSTSLIHRLGSFIPNIAGDQHDGYMADVHYIDGTTLTASDFGETGVNGFWIPKAYAGSYGTNGFYLDFSNSSMEGEDNSGNGNDLSNVGVPRRTDTPTNNYSILNSGKAHEANSVTEAGLTAVLANQSGGRSIHATLPISSGKWYAEMLVVNNGGDRSGFGIVPDAELTTDYAGRMPGGITYTSTGNYNYNQVVLDSGPASYTVGDVIGVRIDLDNNILEYFKNNVSQGVINDLLNQTNYVLTLDNVGNVVSTTVTLTLRTNEDFWSYTPPVDYKAISSENIVGTEFPIGQPDLVWIKNRNTISDNYIFDSSRGVQNYVMGNQIDGQLSDEFSLLQFNKGGFKIGGSALVNTLDDDYAAFNWKKGVTPGFDIVIYSGTGGTQTINHGLGTIPDMIIHKKFVGAQNYAVYHKDANNGSPAFHLRLNNNFARVTSTVAFANSNPTSTWFAVGNYALTGDSGTNNYIAYLFTSVEGFSKFGKYTGDGSIGDGPFVYCGFKPAYILIKSSTTVQDWVVKCPKFESTNVLGQSFAPNTTAVELGPGDTEIDILSNGFKIRGFDNRTNTTAATYIFMAFAETPFQYSRAI